ncbi:MAG: HEPN domain-containing protein [Candidatus Odinarchaeota archaeon]|nr:HEPN domain-containing protein [Candidatus Odinarchaeota archaeon]
MSHWEVEAKRWLEDALEDLKVAEALLKLSHFAASCFHSQQAAEKALKALLYKRGMESRTHSIHTLLVQITKTYNVDISQYENQAKLLDKHYTPPRYPNLHPGIELPAHKLYVKEDAELCLKAAKSILNMARELLKK